MNYPKGDNVANRWALTRLFGPTHNFDDKLVRTFGVFEDTSVRSQVISASIAELDAILSEIEAIWGKETRDRIYKVKSMSCKLLAALELERRGECPAFPIQFAVRVISIPATLTLLRISNFAQI